MIARAPASSANLGPGFDTLAVALGLYVEVSIEPADAFSITTEGCGAGRFDDERHLAARVAGDVLGHHRFALRVNSSIPLSRGLGSSAALTVAAAAAAGAGDPLTVAADVDGHAENAAASVLGGLYSSTATTVVLARRSRDGGMSPEIEAGIVAATGMMYLRVLAMCSIFSFALGRALILPLTIPCALMLLLAPVLAAVVTWADTKVVRALLGPSRSVELERRVERLSESRAGVVDAADAERRRIERDLHDGAQQRLVSLAMNLGMARENLTELPAPARKVIAEAHDEAKEALAELRALVRGLHPAVLDDRGLDAALSGIGARAPLPVKLIVDMPERASPTIEAVAYFVASECLANIARHAAATQAEIDVRRTGGLLRIRITDDGVGGADPARGTGLASLARRAGSVDGSMQIESPAGGPTVVTVELPCGS